jgi:hypothetical protein
MVTDSKELNEIKEQVQLHTQTKLVRKSPLGLDLATHKKGKL